MRGIFNRLRAYIWHMKKTKYDPLTSVELLAILKLIRCGKETNKGIAKSRGIAENIISERTTDLSNFGAIRAEPTINPKTKKTDGRTKRFLLNYPGLVKQFAEFVVTAKPNSPVIYTDDRFNLAVQEKSKVDSIAESNKLVKEKIRGIFSSPDGTKVFEIFFNRVMDDFRTNNLEQVFWHLLVSFSVSSEYLGDNFSFFNTYLESYYDFSDDIAKKGEFTILENGTVVDDKGKETTYNHNQLRQGVYKKPDYLNEAEMGITLYELPKFNELPDEGNDGNISITIPSLNVADGGVILYSKKAAEKWQNNFINKWGLKPGEEQVKFSPKIPYDVVNASDKYYKWKAGEIETKGAAYSRLGRYKGD